MHPLVLEMKPTIQRREMFSEMAIFEKLLWQAAIELEKRGPDYRLREAIRLLDAARALAADFIDGIGDPKS